MRFFTSPAFGNSLDIETDVMDGCIDIVVRVYGVCYDGYGIIVDNDPWDLEIAVREGIRTAIMDAEIDGALDIW